MFSSRFKERTSIISLLDCKTERLFLIRTASSEFGTYRLCEQRRFRRACASAQSRQNLRCSLIQAVYQEELSDRKPDPWPLWKAGHAQLKFVMTECSKTQIRLTGLIWKRNGVREISSYRDSTCASSVLSRRLLIHFFETNDIDLKKNTFRNNAFYIAKSPLVTQVCSTVWRT